MEKKRIGQFIDVLTDYHANGAYKKLKENVELLDDPNFAIMVRTLNFERNDFVEDLKYITEDAYQFLAKSKVYPDDILMNKIANPGSVYIMPDLNRPVSCGMNLFLIRFSKCVNQRYMFYCMKNSEAYIKSFAHGTATKTITKDEVSNLELLMHTTIEDQNIVADILTAFDKKIEVNGAISRNLLKQAIMLFRYYFGSKESNGTIGDILIENAKSKIKVGDARGISGKYPFFTSGKVILEYPEALVSGNNIYLNTGGNADVKYYIGEAAYSTDTWCVKGKESFTEYLYLLLLDMLPEMNKVYFEGSALKHLQKKKLKQRSIYIPSLHELSEFNSRVYPLLDVIRHKYVEDKKISTMRDKTMHQIMSGELAIPELC